LVVEKGYDGFCNKAVNDFFHSAVGDVVGNAI
jgi:hypothetical protein